MLALFSDAGRPVRLTYFVNDLPRLCERREKPAARDSECSPRAPEKHIVAAYLEIDAIDKRRPVRFHKFPPSHAKNATRRITSDPVAVVRPVIGIVDVVIRGFGYVILRSLATLPVPVSSGDAL